jgi:hypothetical protein
MRAAGPTMAELRTIATTSSKIRKPPAASKSYDSKHAGAADRVECAQSPKLKRRHIVMAQDGDKFS